MKILDMFTIDINMDNTSCDNNIQKINTQLQERKIDADNIIKIDSVLINDRLLRYYIIYKKELKTYDFDPRMI